MRIQRLEIEGFGPFAARQVIDFEALDETGLFLITGRTGSGKSSILDAICFALYGSAPRYDGTQARLRSDHAAIGTPTSVTLELTVGTDRWRVVRSPEYDRPKRRGDGVTREPQSATLERWEPAGAGRSEGGWVGVAARPVDVAEHLGPILRLTREQFLQVILLAQGRFQEFLKARSEERLGLLRALFGTERFARFEAEVAERAKALEQRVGGRAAALRADTDRLAALADEEPTDQADTAWARDRAAALAAAAAAAGEQADAARAAFDAADRAAAHAVAVADLQRRRTTARAALERLEGERAAVDATRARIADAVRVLPVLPAVTAAERAAAALPAAERAVAAARKALGEDVTDPAQAGAELDGHLGALDDVLRLEQALPSLERAVQAAARALEAADRDLAALATESAALPDRRRELQAVREAAGETAAGLPAAEDALVRAQRLRAAVGDAGTAATAAQRADVALERALAAEQAAVGRTRALLAARIAGAAGLLAATLQPDEPCPVCGGAEHPHPAEPDAETPDDATVTAAEEAQRAASDARALASTAAGAARAAHAAAVAASGGADEATAAGLLRDAQDAVQAARAAAGTRDEADRGIAALDARAAGIAQAIAGLQPVRTERVAALAAARGSLTAATDRVATARGDAASVADVVLGLRRRRDALHALADARRRLEAAAGTDREAQEVLAAALADSGVTDAGSARSAALAPADRAALEQRVRAWETARDGATAQLSDPAVAAAPAEPVDVDGAVRTKSAALAARDAASDALAAARTTAGVAHELAERIAAADAELAEDRAQLAVVGPLAEVVRGGGTNALRMRLESYVLAARLEQIVTAANARLSAMTDGRFVLQHDDGVAYRGARSGLGLEVLDEHTGRPRPVASLSGGETFLASLALALGLAEVVSAEAGGVRLDTLFVDEGFGSLDRRTLDTAMETLDSLRAGGRTVGLISHVEAMQEDIPAGLHVERLPDGSSEVRSRLPATV